MRSIKLIIMSNNTFTQIPKALNIDGTITAGTGLSRTGSVLNLEKATSNSIGGILPPDGYYIDSSTGQLKEKNYTFFERRIYGYNITTEQPTEGWYNGETLVEQDLSDTNFTPITNTFYKHIGTTLWLCENIIYKYMNNGIYYYNGETFICYCTNNGTTNFPIYTPLSTQQTWTETTFYNYIPNDSIICNFNSTQSGDSYNLKRMFLQIINATGINSNKLYRIRGMSNKAYYIMGYDNIYIDYGKMIYLDAKIIHNKEYIDSYYGYGADHGFTHKQFGNLVSQENITTNFYFSGLGSQSVVPSNTIINVYGVSF